MALPTIGKHTPTAYYIHISQLSSLSEEEQSAIAQGFEQAGLSEDTVFNVLKIAHDLSSLSFLNYPDFFNKGFPELESSWHVDLKLKNSSHRTYANSLNPPILHRKELLLSPEHPEQLRFQTLTKEADKLGLFKDSSRIGFLNQWIKLVMAQGYHVEGHQFVPLGNDEIIETNIDDNNKDGLNVLEKETEVQRHRTAMVRYGFSAPIQALMRFGFLDGEYSIFDYGCGRGDDLRGLLENDIEACGWDPHYAKEQPKVETDIVNLGFVLNVIEDYQERVEAVQGAYSLAKGLLVISVMLENNNTNLGKSYRDGILTSRDTFQKYYIAQEIRDFIEEQLHADSIAVAPGVFFVFKDKVLQQRYLLGRSRSRVALRANLKVAPRRTSEERDEEKYQEYKELLEDLWIQWQDYGREPATSEVKNLNALKKTFGSLAKALRFLRRQKDDSILDAAEEAKREDLQVFLALELFKQRTAMHEMSSSFRRDIKVYFGSITSARNSARELLFKISNNEEIEEKCNQAATEGLGFLLPKKSLQLHTSLVERLPALLRVYVGCATALYGDVTSADLVKIHMHSGKISMMRYDDFSAKAIPKLVERVKIDFRKQKLQLFVYGDEFEPQNLYKKSNFMNEEMDSFLSQSTFDEQLDKLQLFDFNGYGPGPKEFVQVLEAKRWKVEGLSLIRVDTISAMDNACGVNYTFRDLIECGETQRNSGLDNLPQQPNSYTALLELAETILDPIIEYFGPIKLTYGFCSPELAKLIPGGIAPKLDQHAAHELNRKGNAICPRLGSAVDFLVEEEDMLGVAQWIESNLSFDRMYYYGRNKPIHISYGPDDLNQVTLLLPDKKGERLVPKTLKTGGVQEVNYLK
jgi:DNA phosphorothioation-associated putative methyltransferase